jgi:hypothetical protein
VQGIHPRSIRLRAWPGRADRIRIACFSGPSPQEVLKIKGLSESGHPSLPASEGSGPLFCAATVTDCDSNCCSKQVASDSKGQFDDRALLCRSRGPFEA